MNANSASYRVRAPHPQELPAAAALGAALVQFHHTLRPERFAILADPLEPGYERFLRARLADPDAAVRVAVTMADEVVGYAFGEFVAVSWADLLPAHGRLHDLYVVESWRRRGIAAALVESVAVQLRTRGAETLVLSAAWDNPGARALFAGLGFSPTMVEMTRPPKPGAAPP